MQRWTLSHAFLAASLLYLLSITQPVPSAARSCIPPSPQLSLPLTQVKPIFHALYINEVMQSSSSYFCTSNAPQPGIWIELYNPQAVPLDLYASHASLRFAVASDPYYLPFNAAIAAHGFLVLYPSANATFATNQALTLQLLIAGSVVDQVDFTPQVPDQSLERLPDGGDSWMLSASPTLGYSNSSTKLGATPSPTRRSTHEPKQGAARQQGGTAEPASTYTSTPTAIAGTQPNWSQLQSSSTSPKDSEGPRQPLTVQTPLDQSTLPGAPILLAIVLASSILCYYIWRSLKRS